MPSSRDVVDTVGGKLTDGAGRRALAGAAVPAAAGVAVAAYRRRARRRGRRGTTYRLRRREAVPLGLRRVTRQEIEEAVARLRGGTDEPLADAIHGARKGFKRLRALVRLARGELGDDAYRRENATFRDAGRALSGARDAEVLVETLDRLEEGSGARFWALRESLERDRDDAVRAIESDASGRAEVEADLAAARARVDAWPLSRDGFAALAPGLRRIYRQGRRAFAAARDEPTDEHLHELRKRVKDFWHASQLLRPADPKRMDARAKRLHTLSDRLGEDHDFAVLAATAASRPECFGDDAARADFATLVAERRRGLQEDALARAAKLYRRKPGRFVKRIGRRWKKRVAA